MMKIALGSDHAGYEYKESIKGLLKDLGYVYKDFGTDSPTSCDYTDYALVVGEHVANGDYDRGILICGTGIGMSIAANKVKGIRAALVENTYSALLTREHNDSNVLCLGSRIVGLGLALEIVKIWLSGEFSQGKHARRIGKIANYENKDYKEGYFGGKGLGNL